MQGVVILGAGLAGLGCARKLPGARVFEAAEYPGGHAYSHEIEGVGFDQGAHICHSKDQEWLDLIYERAGDVHQIPQSSVSNFWHGHWVSYPVQNHLHELPVEDRIKALNGFVHAQVEHKGETPANYEEWCRFQYGDYLTDNFYAEYTAKYWRVPMAELALDWLGGRLLPSQVERIISGAVAAPKAEGQAAFAKFHYPSSGGFFSFFKHLYGDLDVKYGHRAVSIDAECREVTFENGVREAYEVLASSVPLPDLVGMIKDAPVDIQEAARVLRDLQLLCVNVILKKPDVSPHHWFYIYDNDIDVSRVSFASNLAPGSAGAGQSAFQAEIFRRQDEDMEIDALTEKAVGDMARLLDYDVARDVKTVKPVMVPHSYVISDAKRSDAVDTIVEWLEGKGITTMGLFGRWKYVWSDRAFRSGEEAAQQILERQRS